MMMMIQIKNMTLLKVVTMMMKMRMLKVQVWMMGFQNPRNLPRRDPPLPALHRKDQLPAGAARMVTWGVMIKKRTGLQFARIETVFCLLSV